MNKIYNIFASRMIEQITDISEGIVFMSTMRANNRFTYLPHWQNICMNTNTEHQMQRTYRYRRKWTLKNTCTVRVINMYEPFWVLYTRMSKQCTEHVTNTKIHVMWILFTIRQESQNANLCQGWPYHASTGGNTLFYLYSQYGTETVQTTPLRRTLVSSP